MGNTTCMPKQARVMFAQCAWFGKKYSQLIDWPQAVLYLPLQISESHSKRVVQFCFDRKLHVWPFLLLTERQTYFKAFYLMCYGAKMQMFCVNKEILFETGVE